MHPDTHLRSASVGKARIYPQLKSCTVINYCLRDSLYRDTAPVPATYFVTGDKFAAPIKLVPRHSYRSSSLYPDGKKCAIPSLHRDSFLAKVPGPCPVLSSGNTTSPYCRAVIVHLEQLPDIKMDITNPL